MKIKSLIGICKKNRTICLYNGKNKEIQYMGDGFSIYPLYNMPLMTDIISDYFALYERISDNGEPYIVAKNGIILVGAIMPYKLIDEEFIEQMQKLTNRAFYNMPTGDL